MLFAILLGMLWVVGVPARLFGIALSLVGVVAFYLAASSPERRTRLTSFIDPFKDFQGAGWQAGHGLLGMSSGGIFGKGLSASQQKWGSLPEAHTDFIFAVLGEELGLVGTLLVLALFGAVAYAAIRLAINTEDPFVRYVSAGVTIWLMSQMIINIGMVLALLPVIGIPLPLVSYGGSALVPSMVALGLLVGFARAEPEAAAALRDRRGERQGPAEARARSSLPGAISAGSARARARSGSSRPGPRGRGEVDGADLCPTAGPAGRRWDGRAHLAPARHGRRAAPRDPDVEITALGTARGLETRVVPEAGYPLELIPPVPLPRRPGVELLRTPGRLRGAMNAAVEVVDRVRPDVVVGFGGYVSVPAYLAARKRKLPLVVHEGNALPGIANKLGARFTDHVATSFPDTDLPHAHYIGLPDPADDQHPRPGGAAGRGARRPSGSIPTGRPCSSPVARRAPGGSTSRSRRGRPAFAAAGVQVLHIVGPKGEASPATTPGGPPYVVRAVRQPDGPRLRRRRRRGLPGRQQHRHRGLRRRAARDLRAAADRQRRAGAQRPPGRRRRWRAARRRRRADPRVGAPHGPRPAHRHRARWRRCPPLPRHLIPLDADEKLADMILRRRCR